MARFSFKVHPLKNDPKQTDSPAMRAEKQTERVSRSVLFRKRLAEEVAANPKLCAIITRLLHPEMSTDSILRKIGLDTATIHKDGWAGIKKLLKMLRNESLSDLQLGLLNDGVPDRAVYDRDPSD